MVAWLEGQLVVVSVVVSAVVSGMVVLLVARGGR